MSINLLFCGDNSVGKTSFIVRHRTGEFIEKYEITESGKVYQLPFWTTMGEINIQITEISDYNTLTEVKAVDSAIIMFDVLRKDTYDNVETWYKEIIRLHGNIPVTIIGNKVDEKNRKVKPKMIDIHRKLGIQYYDVSTRSNYNFEKPFLNTIRNFYDNQLITFVENR